jgi:hypothetical protein
MRQQKSIKRIITWQGKSVLHGTLSSSNGTQRHPPSLGIRLRDEEAASKELVEVQQCEDPSSERESGSLSEEISNDRTPARERPRDRHKA